MKKLRLNSVRDLARSARIPEDHLRDIADRAPELYFSPRETTKPGGGSRKIDAPQLALKRVQKAIDRRILRRIGFSDVAYGGIPGRSHVDGAKLHATGADTVACIDIKSFFPSVPSGAIYQLLRDFGCSPDVARLVTRLTTKDGRLPQGSPASTTLANLFLHSTDHLLATLAAQNVTSSRVIDDIAISGAHDDVCNAVGKTIRELHRLGLRVNRKKLQVQHRGKRQQVTKLNVGKKVSLPRRSTGAGGLSQKRLRDSVRRASRYGVTDDERRSLEGQLRYLSQFNSRRARALQERLRSAPTLS